MPTHFRKIPPHVRSQLAQLASTQVVAGCLTVVKAEDIIKGDLAHLDISLDESGVHYQVDVLPPASQGKYSDRNTNGWEEVRYDCPKESYALLLEAPNWHNSGTHSVFQTRERFPKLFHAPQFSTISVECSDAAPGRGSYAFKFEVSAIHERHA